VYIHTAKNVLIEIHPSLRIPRTFKRFAGLMIELLQKNKIRAAQTNEVLMKVISNPVDKYLAPAGKKIGLSVVGDSVNMRNFCGQLFRMENYTRTGALAGALKEPSRQDEGSKDKPSSQDTKIVNNASRVKKNIPITFVIGAVAHCDPVTESNFGEEYVEQKVSISGHGLSASCVCSKICHEFEHLFGVD
jgi:rRNA small subunit pseudouridine methyltransferase Nep1